MKSKKVFLAVALLIFSNSVFALTPQKIESIKDVLRNVQKTDQDTRLEIQEKQKTMMPTSPEIRSLWDKQNFIDSENQRKIEKILEEIGWPRKSDFGSLGPAEAIFLVIQHSDLDFQKKYYKLLKLAAESGDLSKSSFAIFEDRILVREGKNQKYGSQLKIDQNTGKYSFYPIEDEENVNKRRSEVGLESLDEYAKRFGIEYIQ
ncbi:MAG: hypothetical protein CVV41_22850 [Candidatus Riflebacteria bacterium HGW-Riflebacteria-1]|nr:MAG: hypothetical protein CVV41_22850 [Candidatus Riflebacteria bacterium HGW-Riflebacteria-1]